MSTLTYNVDHLISTTANDVTINASSGFDIDSTKYDAAFFLSEKISFLVIIAHTQPMEILFLQIFQL